jgi:hypothetical protein
VSTKPQSVAEMAAAKEKPALKVWQYEIPLEGYPREARMDGAEPGFTITMPAGARILTVGRAAASARGAVLFALVNPEMAVEKRYFYIAKTNHPLASAADAQKATGWANAKLDYVNSWLGWDVWWHLFEVSGERGKTSER